MGKRLTLYIVIAMIAGIGTGYALNVSYPAGNKSLADIADMLKEFRLADLIKRRVPNCHS